MVPVEAGFPSPADDYIEGQLDLNKHLIKHPAATFFVRATGESMINAGIFPNDILIVDRDPEVVGILAARDIVMKVTQKSMDRKNTTISMIMTHKPEELPETATIGKAFNKFSLGHFRHLPVRQRR